MPGKYRTILVTGASGFVGRAVVERLLQEPDTRVRCLMRAGSESPVPVGGDQRVSACAGDITRPETLANVMDGVWGVVNLAGYREFWAQRREHFYAINHRGAQNVFRAALAAGTDKVVQVSTPLAYGIPRSLPFDEHSEAGPHPSDYGRSKYLGDQAGWRLHRDAGLPLTIVHLAAVIGAGDDKATMEVRRAVERRLPALVGSDTTYTYVYRHDAAEAIVRALLSPTSVGHSYLIGDQRATTREYFQMIGDLAAVPIPNTNIPERLLLPAAKVMEWLSRRTGQRPVIPLDVIRTTAAGSLLFDAGRSKRELDMQYTPLHTALAESVAEIQAGQA
jgi:dihydroflavonol-4-reductase